MKKVSIRKRMISFILAGTMCFSLCSCGAKATVDDVVDQVANVVQAEDENVLAVKNGTNSNYPEVTYGEAFEAFFELPTWKYFKCTQEGPDDDGDGEPDYTTDNIDVVEFTGTCTYQKVEVKALIQFTLDNEGDTFDATYLSFNEVPQSTLMLAGLLSKVFESYLEDHSNDATENTVESKTDTESDVTNDIDSTYDYEAMSYAGNYVGNNGYTISFSAYSSVEDDEIGVAEISRNGKLVASQPVYICTDRGDWSGEDYDQFYIMSADGYNEYLGFYESEGSMWVDYNGPGKNYDSLEMSEHYES